MLQLYNSFEYHDRIILIVLFMIFLHIIADYLVQTDFIARFKQRKNWEEYDTKGHYKYDYLAVLLVHSFSWSIITFIPLLIEYKDVLGYTFIILVNTIIHAIVDDLKANKFKINLIQDQLIHILQILITTIFIYTCNY